MKECEQEEEITHNPILCIYSEAHTTLALSLILFSLAEILLDKLSFRRVKSETVLYLFSFTKTSVRIKLVGI